jgi:hypothetical protein
MPGFNFNLETMHREQAFNRSFKLFDDINFFHDVAR